MEISLETFSNLSRFAYHTLNPTKEYSGLERYLHEISCALYMGRSQAPHCPQSTRKRDHQTQSQEHAPSLTECGPETNEWNIHHVIFFFVCLRTSSGFDLVFVAAMISSNCCSQGPRAETLGPVGFSQPKLFTFSLQQVFKNPCNFTCWLFNFIMKYPSFLPTFLRMFLINPHRAYSLELLLVFQEFPTHLSEETSGGF